MRIALVTASAALLAAVAPVVSAQSTQSRTYDVQQSDNAPQIDLWLDQVSYHQGDRIAPHFVTEPEAYVTIVKVNSDGELTVLYPHRPLDQRPFQKAQLVNDRVPFYAGDNRFQVYGSRGMGFVFAIASFDKFDYGYFSSGNQWNWTRLANDSRYGDPFEIVRRFVDRALPSADYSLDYVSYEVDNTGARSRYASRYIYNSYNDYYDNCVSAFGLRYTPYCQSAYPGYYGQVIVGRPGTPTPNVPSGPNYANKHIRPVTGDPMVHGAPQGPQPTTEGRLPPNNSAEEAALAARRDRLSRQIAPRDRSSTNVEPRPVVSEPRVYAAPAPRTEPMQRQPDRQPIMRAEPRLEPRVEPRVEQPRPQPVQQQAPQPRVEVRNDPPRQVQQSAPAPAPRTTAAPAEKDHDN